MTKVKKETITGDITEIEEDFRGLEDYMGHLLKNSNNQLTDGQKERLQQKLHRLKLNILAKKRGTNYKILKAGGTNEVKQYEWSYFRKSRKN